MANDDAGIAPLVARMQALQPALIVLEATGGLEVPVTAALTAAGLPIVVVNPRHARDVATATGRLAKTDALDARGLAHVAEAVRPAPRPLPDAQTQALSAQLARRRQLLDRLIAEKNRLGSAPPTIQADIQAHIAWLERRLADLNDDLGQAIRASPVGRAQDDLLQSTPGVGPGRSHTLGRRPPGVGNLQPAADRGLGRGRPPQPGSWHPAGQTDRVGRPSPRARRALYEHPRSRAVQSGPPHLLRASASCREGPQGRVDRLYA